MNRSIGANDVLAFLLELGALALVVKLFLGFRGLGIWRFVAAAVALAAVITLWALFFAPTASHRLTMPWLFWGKLVILMLPGMAFLQDRRPVLALIWGVLVMGHLIIGAVQKSL